jgi:two-component system alkaline phosphatase synthesis response regulator PhoP
LSGLRLIEEVRLLGISTPIIILSTYGSDSDVEEGLRAGADDYMKKPIISHVFSDKVGRFIAGSV